MLDGASAFGPANPDPAAYVDLLGARLRDALSDDPHADLTDVLTSAIEVTADEFDLMPGGAPSSTLTIARWVDGRVDLLVLGDSQISTPMGTLRDSRLDNIAVEERKAYRARLAEGHGYDDTHRSLLAKLQTEQASQRNRPDGYWIAEADPAAADNAITQTHPTSTLPWLILATVHTDRLSTWASTSTPRPPPTNSVNCSFGVKDGRPRKTHAASNSLAQNGMTTRRWLWSPAAASDPAPSPLLPFATKRFEPRNRARGWVAAGATPRLSIVE